MESKSTLSLSDVIQKLEYYCAYQERCHVEVRNKLKQFNLTSLEKDQVIVHLIDHNFLNEERFAQIFAISKFHQNGWGKNRISNELKMRQISSYLIQQGLKVISEEEYEMTFIALAEMQWGKLTETNLVKKRKKCCDFLLRKGWESHKVFDLVMSFV